MSASDLAILAWGLGAAAIVGAILVWIRWLSRNLNHAAFGAQIEKLVHAGNVERARKLCNAAPKSPVAQSVARCIDQLAGPGAEPGAETIARLRSIYTTSMRTEMVDATRVLYIAAIVIACASVDGYLVAADGVTPAALALPGVAVAMVLHTYRTVRRVALEGAQVGEHLFPILAAAKKR